MSKPKTVDSYIASANSEAQSIMKKLREIIRSTVPEAEEGISWNVPIYKYHGILAGYDVAKSHVSFGIDALSEEDRDILDKAGFKTGKKTVKIKFSQTVPAAVIKKLLRAQASINESKK